MEMNRNHTRKKVRSRLRPYHSLRITNILKRKGFTFLQLPPELWSYICELVILEPAPINSFTKLGWKANALTVMQPGISRTCRLLRRQTLAMFYERNAFVAYNQNAMPYQLVH